MSLYSFIPLTRLFKKPDCYTGDIPVCIGVGCGGCTVTLVCGEVVSPVYGEGCGRGGGRTGYGGDRAADARSWEVVGCAGGETVVSGWLSEVDVPESTSVLSTRQYFVSRTPAN